MRHGGSALAARRRSFEIEGEEFCEGVIGDDVLVLSGIERGQALASVACLMNVLSSDLKRSRSLDRPVILNALDPLQHPSQRR